MLRGRKGGVGDERATCKGWVLFGRSMQCSVFCGRHWARRILVFIALALSRVSRPQQRHSHARCIFIRMCHHAFNHTSHKPIWPGYKLILSAPWLNGHCRAVPAFGKNLSSSSPPTRALWITDSPHTSWCRIYCDHSSRAAECSSNFAHYGSRVTAVRSPRIKRNRYLLARRRLFLSTLAQKMDK